MKITGASYLFEIAGALFQPLVELGLFLDRDRDYFGRIVLRSPAVAAFKLSRPL